MGLFKKKRESLDRTDTLVLAGAKPITSFLPPLVPLISVNKTAYLGENYKKEIRCALSIV